MNTFAFTRAAFLIASLGLASAANAAIMQLASPAQISTDYLYTFETRVTSGPVTFDATANREASWRWTHSLSPSGESGLVESRKNGPLRATLSSKYNAVGLFFGNDDFNLVFDAILTVYASATKLGSVTVTSNGNDFADQFIGLSSTVAFDRVEINYQRPEANNLSIYIDDFRLGSPTSVPEPASLALLGIGLAGLGVIRRKQRN